MTNKQTRRAILAGAAALPSLAIIPAMVLGAANTDADPIFEAIEKHKIAFQHEMKMCRIQSYTANNDPKLREIEVAATWAFKTSVKAGRALIETMPTTGAGIIALMEYVEQFNRGEFLLEETRNLSKLEQWGSGSAQWPIVDGKFDSDGNMFGFEVMANVRRALKALTVQS